jgi:hypothetical protein
MTLIYRWLAPDVRQSVLSLGFLIDDVLALLLIDVSFIVGSILRLSLFLERDLGWSSEWFCKLPLEALTDGPEGFEINDLELFVV